MDEVGAVHAEELREPEDHGRDVGHGRPRRLGLVLERVGTHRGTQLGGEAGVARAQVGLRSEPAPPQLDHSVDDALGRIEGVVDVAHAGHAGELGSEGSTDPEGVGQHQVCLPGLGEVPHLAGLPGGVPPMLGQGRIKGLRRLEQVRRWLLGEADVACPEVGTKLAGHRLSGRARQRCDVVTAPEQLRHDGKGGIVGALLEVERPEDSGHRVTGRVDLQSGDRDCRTDRVSRQRRRMGAPEP